MTDAVATATEDYIGGNWNPLNWDLSSAFSTVADTVTSATDTVLSYTSPAYMAYSHFNSASYDTAYKIGEGLGLKKGSVYGFEGGGVAGISSDLIREGMATAGADKSLTAMINANGAETPQGKILTQIRDNPELSQFKGALHQALVNDPTMLDGFQSVMGAGADKFNLTDVQNALNDPQKRGFLTQVLTKVGDGSKDAKGNDISFAHVKSLMDHSKQLDIAQKAGDKNATQNAQKAIVGDLNNMGIDVPGFSLGDFMEFFREFMQNPTMAMNNLVNKMVETGQIDVAHGNELKGFLAPMGETMKTMIKPYHDVAVKHEGLIDRTRANAVERGQEMAEKYGGPSAQTLG